MTTATKLDLKRELRHLYRPSAKQVERVDVPAMNFLMIDGRGDPNTSAAYAEAIEALFSLAYGVKFAVKKSARQVDYGVMPLEGLWWADDLAAFANAERAAWKWTMMIMQPDFVDRALVSATTAQVAAKKHLAALGAIRFESFAEGSAAQVMHVGPFANEAPTIQRVHAYIEAAGCQRAGKHHEIYLSDIRKADPAKWQTVIRQPMR